MPADLKLVLLDVDGTLVDSQHNIVAAMAMACADAGIAAPTAAATRGIIGLSLYEAVETLLPGHAVDVHRVVAEGYKNAFRVLRTRPDHQEFLFPGAVEAVTALEDAGYLLGLATGKSRRGALSFLERHGFAGRFVTVQTADDGPGKPHPAMILAGLGEAGVRPADTAMVGDTTFDMMMARAAGVGAVGVSWGNHPAADLRGAGAHVVLDDFGGLVAAVAALTSGKTADAEPLGGESHLCEPAQS